MIPDSWMIIWPPCDGVPMPAEFAHSRWKAVSELFPPLPKGFQINALPEALQKVWPLNARRQRALSGDINDLSRLLTCERGDLRGPYWNRPGYVSAYLYYFLPWNIVRLGRLFSGLRLPAPVNLQKPLLLDAGSGPLSLPIALWLAKPAWRRLPIHVTALDAAKQPLHLGASIFQTLGEILGEPVWPVKTVAGPLQALGRIAPRDCQTWLITAANVLNELKPKRRHGYFDREDDGNDKRFYALLAAWSPLWRTDSPWLLFAEPGTRLGSGAIMSMRESALEFGLAPAAPCPHAKPCPLLEKRGSWCHFVYSAQEAPSWLKETSREARLFKTSLSLSPLLLAPRSLSRAYPAKSLPCRVVSQEFAVKGSASHYGCSARGLCLLPDSRGLFSGSLTLADAPHDAPRDGKSGAVIVSPFNRTGQANH